MSSENAIIQRILEAFSAIQSPYSTNEQREGATAFIEELKRQRDCSNYIHHILRQSQSMQPAEYAIVRFLSLKVLEDWLFLSWNQFSVEEHLQMRLSVLDLVNNHMYLYENDRSIRTKLAKIITEITKRQVLLL